MSYGSEGLFEIVERKSNLDFPYINYLITYILIDLFLSNTVMSAISFKLGVVAQPSQHKFCHKESVVRTWCSYNCKYTICPLTLACIITSHDLLSENLSFAEAECQFIIVLQRDI